MNNSSIITDGSVALPRKKNKIKRGDLIFYILILAWPVLQFCVFYIGVNLNSFALAFENIFFDSATESKVVEFAGFDNFVRFFTNLVNDPMWFYAIRNSLTFFALSVCINIPFGIIFAYYIFKKGPLAKFFQVVLFVPSIISSLVTVIMYKYFVDSMVPSIINEIFGTKLSGLFISHALECIFIFNLLTGFGTSTLLYLGAMKKIPTEVLEAAHIDGASPVREFVSIVLPQIFSTISVFLISAIAAIFTNQINLFSFFYYSADQQYYTVGYYLYRSVALSQESEYPYLACIGMVITSLIAPIAIILRKVFAKVDPMAD